MPISIQKLTVGAAISAAMHAPNIAVANDETLSLSIEGGAVASDHTRNKLGAPSDVVGGDNGLYGSVEVVRGIKADWDWSASASTFTFSPNSFIDASLIDGSSGGIGASATGDFGANSFNFDIGRNWQIGKTAVRLGVGVEALKTTQETGVSKLGIVDDSSGNGFYDADLAAEFLGVGPRVSADAEFAIAPNSPVSLYGGVSAAVMRGQYNVEKGVTAFDGVGDSYGGELAETITGNARRVSLDLGASYALTDTTQFRAGIRSDRFDFDDSMMADDSVEVDTAYVGVKIDF